MKLGFKVILGHRRDLPGCAVSIGCASFAGALAGGEAGAVLIGPVRTVMLQLITNVLFT